MSASHEGRRAESKGKAVRFPEMWRYCCDVAGSSTIPILQKLFSGSFSSVKAFLL